jgi:hypothetical protein
MRNESRTPVSWKTVAEKKIGLEVLLELRKRRQQPKAVVTFYA